MKKKIAITLTVVFAIAFAAYIYVYETYLHGTLNSVQAVVAGANISKNEVITEGDVKVIQYPKDLVNKEMMTDVSDIVGMRAVGPIAANDIFTNEKLGSAELHTQSDQKLFGIPGNWIASVPGSIRRLDKTDIWLIFQGSQEQEEGESAASKTSFNESEPILKNKVVGYIKSSKNSEVQGLEGNENRLDAESNPNRIELSLTNDEFQMLSKAVSEGYKLIFSY